jgi:hypothetical protein
MLYLNMLYNMTKFGIENQFEKILFGRTALEIKSSIGAAPILMSGFIYHNNKFINRFIDKIFPKLEPPLVWQQRHPFKYKRRIVRIMMKKPFVFSTDTKQKFLKSIHQ